MAAEAPLLVLSDSTLQLLLNGLSYGIYPFFSGYVLSCPGAAVNIIHSGHNVPPILELLHRMGGKSFRALLQHEGLVAMLKAHVGSDINVRFIPIERSSWLRAEFNTDSRIRTCMDMRS